jgi:hypothetical protein
MGEIRSFCASDLDSETGDHLMLDRQLTAADPDDIPVSCKLDQSLNAC